MRRVVMFVFLAVVAAAWFAFVEPQDDPVASPGQSQGAPAGQTVPPEAGDTIAAIDAGGPFRYERDGAVFQNREGRLPAHERGYWREYTVQTPGSDDRGPRRLVEGRKGELFYTDDHYGSFIQIRAPGDGS